MKQINEKIKVNKLTYNYILHMALYFGGVEAIGGIIVFWKMVPIYIPINIFIGSVFGIICAEIVILVLFLYRKRYNYFVYEENGDFICFFNKGFCAQKAYIPLSHIKFVIITQNVFQKKYDLADVVISTGVTRHKFQSLSKNDADNIKDELGVLMSENAYKDK